MRSEHARFEDSVVGMGEHRVLEGSCEGVQRSDGEGDGGVGLLRGIW